MAKYIYPAVFTKENNEYLVTFPDIEGCYTHGLDIAEAMDMAADALCLMLYGYEEDGVPIPGSSDISEMVTEKNTFTTLISCDTAAYRKFFDNKAVKKTLSIPSWLNKEAEAAHINFSSVLKEALINQLNLQ